MSAKITQKLDRLRRVALPMEYCSTLGLNENDSIDICLNAAKNMITLIKAVPSCCICNDFSDLIQISGKCICIHCKERLVNAVAGDCLY